LAALLICAIGLLLNSRNLDDGRRHRGADSEDYLRGDGPPPPPENNFWESRESSCIHVDDVCSWGSGWFYGPPSGRDRTSRQPTISLDQDARLKRTHIYLDGLNIDRRIQFSVSSRSHERYNDSACSFSSVTNHLVVQSAYNDMMGEFYVRSILGLNRWMRDFFSPSYIDIQIYVHFVDRRKERLLEGHKLFLGGLPNNDIFDSLVSLMPKSDACRCYKKLIFCGYKVENASTAISDPVANSDTSTNTDEDSIVITPGPSITNPKTTDLTDDVVYGKLRTDLIGTYLMKEPDLDEKIAQYQKQILIQKGLELSNNASGWKIVGLTHRRYRRVWLNIDDVVSMCDEKFISYKIVCIKVDVEAADSVEEQLLMHRSLHAVIGVHGAQLTQGVLLKKDAYILELLPWVPYYLWGGWVTTTHVPTPLGIIFKGTDLNHVGHPLGRDSVPLCLHVNSSDVEADRLCLMNRTSGVIDRFRWADRDFIVSSKVIEDFISTFLLNEDDSVCDVMKKGAERTNFVLYNVFCKARMNESIFVARQYYREENWMLPKNPHTLV
jgi:hypothetical protein